MSLSLDRTTRTQRPGRIRIGLVLGLGLLGASATRPALAAPLRHRIAVAAVSGQDPNNPFPRYFQRALQAQSLHVHVPTWANMQLTNGLLPDTPMIQYLQWRRGLNPDRFDFYHPRMGPALAQDLATRSQPRVPPQVSPEVIVPASPPRPAEPGAILPPTPTPTVPTPTPTPIVAPQVPTPPPVFTSPPPVLDVPPGKAPPPPAVPGEINPPPVPEPHPALLAVALIGSATWLRRRFGPQRA